VTFLDESVLESILDGVDVASLFGDVEPGIRNKTRSSK
jgi:hypothetical protein